MKNSRPIILDDAPPGYRPSIQVIDNFERNHKLGLVFECSVGGGKLLVCSIDLLHLLEHPEARQLYASLLGYVNSAAFDPKTTLPPELLAGLFPDSQQNAQPAKTIDDR